MQRLITAFLNACFLRHLIAVFSQHSSALLLVHIRLWDSVQRFRVIYIQGQKPAEWQVKQECMQNPQR